MNYDSSTGEHLNSDTQPLRILLVQSEISHYRSALVTALAADSSIQLVLGYDQRDSRLPSRARIELLVPASDSTSRSRQVDFVTFAGFGYQRRLRQLVSEVRPDIIILGGNPRYVSSWLFLLGRRFAHSKSAPVLVWTQGWTRKDSRMVGIVKRNFFRLFDGCLLYSQRGRSLGLQQGFVERPLFVVGNSIQSCRDVRPNDLPLTFPSPLRLVCVSRLTADRELGDVLRAQALLSREGIQTHFHLVGEGPARDELLALSHSLGVEVSFHGALYDPEDLNAIYAASHVCVVPGRAGLAVIQAMGHGLPVIAHDDLDIQMPEVEAIIPGRNGNFYTRGDASSLKSVIVTTMQQVIGGQISSEAVVDYVRLKYSAEAQARAFLEAARFMSKTRGSSH